MTLSQQAPSLVERLNDPIAHDRETTVQLICRWRTERREAAARITELEDENEQLRLAICGGEDAPGYAASLPLATILQVQANNEQTWRARAEQASPAEPSGWRPMESAPKDGTYILARVAPQDDDDRWGYLSGRCFVIRHEERTPSGYDLGWSVFPGFGGVSDDRFEGWLTLPPTSEGGGA